MAKVRISDYFSMGEQWQYDRAESLFCAPAWIKVLGSSYGYSFYTAFDEAQNTAIHFALIDNILGKKLSSLPFSDYTDIDFQKSGQYNALLTKIKSDFGNVPLVLKTKGMALSGNSQSHGQVIRNAYMHRIATNSAVEVKNNQSSAFKRNVNQAQKKDIEIRRSYDKSALNAFYGLYHGLRMDKFESIPQPFGFFENIYEGFIARKQGFALEAVYQDEVIASIIVLVHKKILFYKFGASSSNHLDLRPNNLLFDALIMYAVDSDIEEIDLGLSGAGDSYKGLVRFKKSMGGVSSDLTYYQHAQGAEVPENVTTKKWVQLLTKEIVGLRPGIEKTSQLSKLIYPLFG